MANEDKVKTLNGIMHFMMAIIIVCIVLASYWFAYYSGQVNQHKKTVDMIKMDYNKLCERPYSNSEPVNDGLAPVMDSEVS